MIKGKSKYDQLKVPMVKSIHNRLSVKPKLQNNIQIRPTASMKRQPDYRFQTDEQIETEQSCKSIVNKQSQQKRKNSFSHCQNQLKQIVFQNQKTHKRRKQLQIFNCDSLAIRPSGNITTKAANGLNKCQNQQKFKCIVLTDIESTNNNQEEKTTVQNFCRLGGSRRNHRRKIFDSKLVNKQPTNYNLPFALLPSNIEIQTRKQNKWGKSESDQFHIIFQTDQITQCCL